MERWFLQIFTCKELTFTIFDSGFDVLTTQGAEDDLSSTMAPSEPLLN